METIVLKTGKPWDITLYKIDNSPYIYAYWTFNQRRIRISTKKTNVNDAVEFAVHKFHKIRREAKNPKIPNFSKILDEFLKEKAKHLKPVSMRTYRFFAKMLGSYFKNVEDITPKALSEYEIFRRKKLREGFKGDVVFNREMTFLSNVLRWTNNFFQLKINIPKVKAYRENRSIQIPTPEEMDMILDWFCINRYYFHYHLIYFLIETGIRPPSEYQKLRWDDVNMTNQTITIRDRKSRHKDDTIPISSKALEILEYFHSNENEYVFGRENNTPPIIKKVWDKAMRDIGLNYTLYITRHFAASRWILNGVPTMVVSKLLGHSSTKMVETRYAHILCDDMRRFVK